MDELKIIFLDYITISSLSYDYITRHCLEKIKNLYSVGGHVKEFMSRAIFRGRCMGAWNKKWKITNRKIGDFDAVSLYPSAIFRLYLATGKPNVINKKSVDSDDIIDNDISDFKKYDKAAKKITKLYRTLEKKATNYIVEVEITKINNKYPFPGVVAKTSNGNEYVNNHTHPEFSKDSDEVKAKNIGLKYSETGNIINVYSQIELQDLVNFYGVEFKILKGYYYTGERDYTIQDTIKKLFELRKLLKSRNNPLQEIIKLMMNSCYGKSIQRTIETTSKFKTQNEIDAYVIKNYNKIDEIITIEENKLYEVKQRNEIDKQFSLVPFGVNILAMSKRIMNEVMCLAYDNNIGIYYQDTDSMHIENDKISLLEKLFEDKYDRKLIGKNLGQFCSDFERIKNKISGPIPWSECLIVLGKKAYYDELHDKFGNTGEHVRLKGIRPNSIDVQAEKYFNGSKRKLFECMYEHNKKKEESTDEEKELVTFNLVTLKTPCFEKNKNLTIESKNSFERTVFFTGDYGDLEKYYKYGDSEDSFIKHQFQCNSLKENEEKSVFT